MVDALEEYLYVIDDALPVDGLVNFAIHVDETLEVDGLLLPKNVLEGLGPQGDLAHVEHHLEPPLESG